MGIVKTTLCILNLLLPTNGLHFIDIPRDHILESPNQNRVNNTTPQIHTTKNESVKPGTSSITENFRRNVRNVRKALEPDTMRKIEEEHDKNLKNKISILVQQTIHDTTKKIESIQHIKDEYHDKPGYKAGFIINLINKSKEVVNELFSVGVKHREAWKALEQLKIYEMLVRSNVDTENLVIQLTEISS